MASVMSDAPGYPDGRYPHPLYDAPARNYFDQTYSEPMGFSIDRASDSLEARQPGQHHARGTGNSSPADEPYAFSAQSTTVSYVQLQRRADTRSSTQFAQYQAHRPGRFALAFGGSLPSTSLNMQSAQAETLPPITAITDAYYPSSALEHQGAYGGNSQAEGSGHAAFNLRQSSQQHGYHSDSYQSQNVPQTHHSQSQQQTHHQHDQPQSSQQQPSHRPQHHQHDQSPSSQQQSSHRPHNVHTLTQQSAYPPTGPATFPSPTLSAASVPDPVNASMSTHSVLRSPTSQTRSSLLEAPQQSFSQLRMFAQKFETDFGSGSATSQQTSQKQHGQHHDGPRRVEHGRSPVQLSESSSSSQARSSVTEQTYGGLRGSPTLPRTEPPQTVPAPPANAPLVHPVQQRWSRQLVPAACSSPNAQPQPPQGTVSPQALSLVPRPSQTSARTSTQRPSKTSEPASTQTPPKASARAPTQRSPQTSISTDASRAAARKSTSSATAWAPPGQGSHPQALRLQSTALQAVVTRPQVDSARLPAVSASSASAASSATSQPPSAIGSPAVGAAKAPAALTTTSSSPQTPVSRATLPADARSLLSGRPPQSQLASSTPVTAQTMPTTSTAASSQLAPSTANLSTPVSETRRTGRPRGTGKRQLAAAAAAREREATVRAAMLSEGIDPDRHPITLAAALKAAASATAVKRRRRKSPTPMLTPQPVASSSRTVNPADLRLTSSQPGGPQFTSSHLPISQSQQLQPPMSQPTAPSGAIETPSTSLAAPNNATLQSQEQSNITPSQQRERGREEITRAAFIDAGLDFDAIPLEVRIQCKLGGTGRPPGPKLLRERMTRAAILTAGLNPDTVTPDVWASFQPPLPPASGLTPPPPRRGRPPGSGKVQRTRAAIIAAGLDPDTVSEEVRASFEPPPRRKLSDSPFISEGVDGYEAAAEAGPPPSETPPQGVATAKPRAKPKQPKRTLPSAQLTSDVIATAIQVAGGSVLNRAGPAPRVEATSRPACDAEPTARPADQPIPMITANHPSARTFPHTAFGGLSQTGVRPPQPAAMTFNDYVRMLEAARSARLSSSNPGQTLEPPGLPVHGPMTHAEMVKAVVAQQARANQLARAALGPASATPTQPQRPRPVNSSPRPRTKLQPKNRVVVDLSSPVRSAAPPPSLSKPAIPRAAGTPSPNVRPAIGGNPLQPGLARMGAPKICALQTGASLIGPTQGGVPQVGPSQVGPSPTVVSLAGARLNSASLDAVSPTVASRNIASQSVTARTAAASITGASQNDAGQNRATQNGTATNGTSQGGASRKGGAQNGPRQSGGGQDDTSDMAAAPPSPSEAPEQQPTAKAAPKRMGPFNHAIFVVPMSRKRRAELITRGVYNPFRDDADDSFERERVNRRPRAAHAVTKVITVAVPQGAGIHQQRVREPEAIKDRFAYPPEPPMREPFKSILSRDSLLNRLGVDSVYTCQWKGCGAELASENKLLRHVQSRNHARQAAFDFGDLVLYQCHWGGCDRPCFRSAGKLEQHMLAKHVCEKIVCPYEQCDLRSSTIGHLHRHVMRNHEDGDEPRPRVDIAPEVALTAVEPLPATVTTVELMIQPALGRTYKLERFQDLAHAKVLKMCIAPPNPEIHILHPPHMLEAIGDEDDSLAAAREGSTREGSAQPEEESGVEGESELESEVGTQTSIEEIVLETMEVADATPAPEKQKRKRASTGNVANKRTMARRTGGTALQSTPRSSQRVAAQQTLQIKSEPVHYNQPQRARRTGPVASPIIVSDDEGSPMPPKQSKGKGKARAPPLPKIRAVPRRRSTRGGVKRALLDCVEVPRIDTSEYKWLEM